MLKTADAPTAAEAGVYTQHCLHLDVTTADTSIAAGDFHMVEHFVEGLNAARFGFGQASTRYVTLSFWHKHTVAGTYCVFIRNSGANRSYLAEYTQSVTDTWEKAEITIPVDTSGTWLYTNGVGLKVGFAVAMGSTYHGTVDTWNAANVFATSNQVNGLSSTSNNFKLALVQLEAGSQATDFEARDAGTELALCQRYYEKSFDVTQAPAQNIGFNSNGCEFWLVGNTTSYTKTRYRVEKRVAATVTNYNTAAANSSARNQSNTADASLSVNAKGTTGHFTGVAGGTDNLSYQWHWTADAEL
jgi:hypothetical protein